MENSASFSSDTYSNDSILAGRPPVASRKITLLSGEANRVRGTVLGRSATSGTIAAVAQAGNTGNGTIGTLTVRPAAVNGIYRAVCVEPGSNLGTFAVFSPDGREIGTAVVGAAFAGDIGFTISDGATDFVSGDSFTITVSAVVFKYLMALAAATDGSQNAEAILAEDADATAGDVDALIYEDGVFNATQLTYGTGHTVDTVRDRLRVRGIQLVGAGTIVNP